MSKKSKDHYGHREAARYSHPIASREAVIAWLDKRGKSVRLSDVLEHFNLPHPKQEDAMRRRMLAMVRDGQLREKKRGIWTLVSSMTLIEGRVKLHRQGMGEVVPLPNRSQSKKRKPKKPASAKPDHSKSVMLPPKQMRGVWEGDVVRVRVGEQTYRNQSLAVLVEILEYSEIDTMGVIEIDGDRARVSALHHEQSWPIKMNKSLRDGDCVQIKVERQSGDKDQVIIGQSLGPLDSLSAQMALTIDQFDLPGEWPKSVLAEVDAMSDKIDMKDREDMTDLPFVTVDGEDAKDFDDAIYVKADQKGWRIWVAIADVSHYVRPGSLVDQEARSRGTSVYFPTKVIPMLPERLSNDLCSLRPDVQRPVLVCEMLLGRDGTLINSSFKRAVIRSHARMTYDDLQAIRDGKKNPPKWWKDVYDAWHEVFDILQAQRKKKGTLLLSIPEAKFECKDDQVVGLTQHRQSEAQMWIEVLMVLANTAAASYLDKHQQPVLYRVHPAPESDRLEELVEQGKRLGILLHGQTAKEIFSECQTYLSGKHGAMLQSMMLRALSQAQYQVENIGHFGLAESHYAHFTSPIRRYPDLWVHRLIVMQSKGQQGDHEEGAGLGQSLTELEKRADRASWQVIDRCKCLYMLDHTGETFKATVVSVHVFGFFVRLDDVGVEAMVHISSLSDYYEFDRVQQRLVGRARKQVFEMGTKTKVLIENIDLVQGRIECAIVS